MALLNTFLSCPADCDTDSLLPAIPEEQDCTNYDLPYSQVQHLYLTPNGATVPLASWSTTPTAVSGAIDNTVTDNSKTKWLVGEGGVESEEVIDEYPGRKEKVNKRVFTLTLNVKNLSGGQYDFMRQLQCGGTSLTFWYADVEDYIFGSAGGIVPLSVNAKLPKGAGRDDRAVGQIIIKWEANADPDRRTNPLN